MFGILACEGRTPTPSWIVESTPHSRMEMGHDFIRNYYRISKNKMKTSVHNGSSGKLRKVEHFVHL